MSNLMYFSWRKCILLIGIVLCSTSALNSTKLNPPNCSRYEKSALLQFKHDFQIDCDKSYSDPSAYPKLKYWVDKPDTDCCSWDGVECNANTGAVIGLNLKSSCLYGTFPRNSTLFNLVHLEMLNLAINNFNYSLIPSELGQLTKLRTLHLYNSAFTGQIPSEISTLSDLTVLDLSRDDDGLQADPDDQLMLYLDNPSLDELVRNLTKLRRLNLDDVDISSTLPTSLTNRTSLISISLQYSNLYGEVPASLFLLPNLEIIRLNGNHHLTGVLPEFPSNSPLVELGLFVTGMSGEIPMSIGNLARLQILYLENSYFSGTLPSSIGNLTNLMTLQLNNNKFVGEIPFSISNLTNLQILGLSDLNPMSEQFRLQLPKFNKLVVLRLDGIELDIEIEKMGFIANLTGLTFLDLSRSKLKGQLPQWFANLTQLTILYLQKNLLEGPIPRWFSQLENLYALQLSDNNLIGEFDTFLGMRNLRALDLPTSGLTFSPYQRNGTSLLKLDLLRLVSGNLTEFPEFLRDQTELKILTLSENDMGGYIPQWLINATKDSLEVLHLEGNRLKGFEQPMAALQWSKLEALFLNDNEIQGSVPVPPTTLQSYIISYNRLSGNLPEEICNAASLSSLDLSYNNLSGEIPDCLADQLAESLEQLDLRNNYLRGAIPRSFTKKCSLKMINLSQNRLQGKLPRSVANCATLQVLDAGNNDLNDTFPSWFGRLPELRVLVLRHNNFHGNIGEPLEINETAFATLRILDVSYNHHDGQLPSWYIQNWKAMAVSKENQAQSTSGKSTFSYQVGGEQLVQQESFPYSITIVNKGNDVLYPRILTVLRVIDFSSNRFTGYIPDVIGHLKGLQALNLSNNNLEGEIPSSLANIADLESLDISRNSLSGAIPQGLSQLSSIEVFNVSYNHLSGPIPQGNQFDTFDVSSYEGNRALCGKLLSKDCRKVDVTPVINDDQERDEGPVMMDWIVRTAGCLSGFIVGVVIGKSYITDVYHEWFVEVFQRKPKRKAKKGRKLRR